MKKTVSRPMHLAEYCYAYSWWRLLGWIIDILVFYAFTFVGTLVYHIANPAQLDAVDDTGSSIATLIGMAIWMLCYFVCEAFCNGRTLGKWITGLKVVDLDGNKPGIGKIALRTLCRLIPFDCLSFFGTDKWSSEDNLDGFWHDSLSKTYVVRVKKIAEYKQLEKEGENVVKREIDVPDDTGSTNSEGEFKPGDKVLYPPVSRVMFVEEVLPNGKIRCFQIDGSGKKDLCGDYAPNQIKHCPDWAIAKAKENPVPTEWESICMIVALVLGFLLYSVFPIWIEIQHAGGFDAWLHDSDARLANILLFLAHLVM